MMHTQVTYPVYTYSLLSDDLSSAASFEGGGIIACFADTANETVKSMNSEKFLGNDKSGNFTSSCGSPGFTGN